MVRKDKELQLHVVAVRRGALVGQQKAAYWLLLIYDGLGFDVHECSALQTAACVSRFDEA